MLEFLNWMRRGSGPSGSEERWTVLETRERGRRLSIRATGEMEFNDAGDWVTGMSPGSLLTLEDAALSRRAEFRPAEGCVKVVYFVGGQGCPLDEEGRSWAARVVRDAVRNHGLGSEQWIARVHATRGIDGIMEEIERIPGDAAMRVHYTAVLGGVSLSTDEFVDIVRHAARMIASDSDKRVVLGHALDTAGDATRLEAVVEATRTLRSSAERRLVLSRVLERRPLPEPVVLGVIRSAGEITSDAEKAHVLLKVDRESLLSPQVDASYRKAAASLRSAAERADVLRRLEGAPR